MKMETHTIERKTGKKVERFEVQIAMPETVLEMSKVFSVERMIKLAQVEYRFKMLRRIKSGRSPRLTVRVAELTIDQREKLKELGLLKESTF